MQVWNVLHAARWKCRTQKIAKNSPSAHHRTTLSGYIFATKTWIDNRKKNLLNSNVSPTCPHNTVSFSLLAAEICCRVWGTPTHFNGFHILAALLHGILGVSQTLRRWTEGVSYIWQGGHHVWHWPTFLVVLVLGTGLLVREALISQHSILVAHAWFSRHWWMHNSVRLTVSTGALKGEAAVWHGCSAFWLTNLVIFCNGWH